METVIDLLIPKSLSVWHSLYMGKVCNSVALSEFLLQLKVHTVGTLRRNREPLESRNPGLMQTGDVVARENSQELVLAWKYKQVVKAIMKHDASVMTITRQKKRGGGETRAG